MNAVEEAVADVVESLGNAISDGLDWLGGLLGRIPLVGGLLGGLFHWLAGVVSGITDLVASIVKGVLGIVGGVVAGLIRIVFGGIGGLLAWNGRVFVKGLGDIGAAIAGAVILILGKLVSLVQAVFFLQGKKEPLTGAEREMLQRVFRGSVVLYNVRLVRGFAGLYSLNSRPFTLGDTIYLKDVDTAAEPDVLVHECTHVWQYQNLGARYTADALGAQATLSNAYDWEAEIARGNTRWQDFNAEAEAQFIQDVFRVGRRTDVATPGPGHFYDDDPVGASVEFDFNGTDRTAFAAESVAYVRSAFSWRLSALF